MRNCNENLKCAKKVHPTVMSQMSESESESVPTQAEAVSKYQNLNALRPSKYRITWIRWHLIYLTIIGRFPPCMPERKHLFGKLKITFQWLSKNIFWDIWLMYGVCYCLQKNAASSIDQIFPVSRGVYSPEIPFFVTTTYHCSHATTL